MDSCQILSALAFPIPPRHRISPQIMSPPLNCESSEGYVSLYFLSSFIWQSSGREIDFGVVCLCSGRPSRGFLLKWSESYIGQEANQTQGCHFTAGC